MDDKTRHMLSEVVAGLIHDANNSLSLLSLWIDEVEDAIENPTREGLQKIHENLEKALEKFGKKIAETSAPYARADKDQPQQITHQLFAEKIKKAVSHVAQMKRINISLDLEPERQLAATIPKDLLAGISKVFDHLFDLDASSANSDIVISSQGEGVRVTGVNGEELFVI